MNQIQNKVGKITVECMMNTSINNGLDIMKLKTLKIKDIGGISCLNIENTHPQMNIICGPNGIGKTTILDCIGHTFTDNHSHIIKKNAKAQRGFFTSIILNDEGVEIEKKEIDIDIFHPTESLYIQGFSNLSKKFIFLKTDRSFGYQNLDSIKKDEKKDNYQIAGQAAHGIAYYDIKGWFVHRHLYSAHKNALKPEQINNFELAKKCFSILNKHFLFSHVDPNENEIMVSTPSGVIFYEYLSSGFKSIISILFGIIKEIELRFKEPCCHAQDFNGIILIDEVELHLHPEWQERVSSVLKEVFPFAQFFITTHSPHVVQTALQGEVIALERKDNEVIKRELHMGEYGYQGWTIEEILEDVMGMPDLRTQKFNEVKARFDNALDDNDRNAAQAAYDELDKMLHPHYPLRPVFRMQLDSLGE